MQESKWEGCYFSFLKLFYSCIIHSLLAVIIWRNMMTKKIPFLLFLACGFSSIYSGEGEQNQDDGRFLAKEMLKHDLPKINSNKNNNEKGTSTQKCATPPPINNRTILASQTPKRDDEPRCEDTCPKDCICCLGLCIPAVLVGIFCCS